jgi:hypothetical protein
MPTPALIRTCIPCLHGTRAAEEAMDTPNGGLVRRCFRLLNAKSIGLTITLGDITEEDFRVLELIEAERQEQVKGEDRGAHGSR